VEQSILTYTEIAMISPIITSVQIQATPSAVFQFVTVAANWKLWHPATISVSGDVHRSAMPGEIIVEKIHVGWYRGQARWTVRQWRAPSCAHAGRWVIEGRADNGGNARIVYTLAAEKNGTHFTRALSYTMPNRFYAWLDRLFMRRLLVLQSERALRQLKQVMESSTHYSADDSLIQPS
jgi:Polyketide cyclase / dehydrase and lipid transport